MAFVPRCHVSPHPQRLSHSIESIKWNWIIGESEKGMDETWQRCTGALLPPHRPPPPGPLLPEPQLNEIRPIAPREPNNKISTKTKESEPGNIFKNEHLAPPPPPSSGVLGGGGKEEEEEEVSGCLLLMMAHPRGSFSLPPFRLMKCPAVVLLCRHVNAPRGHEL